MAGVCPDYRHAERALFRSRVAASGKFRECLPPFELVVSAAWPLFRRGWVEYIGVTHYSGATRAALGEEAKERVQ